MEPPAGRSTALVFRCADGRFALSIAKNTVQRPRLIGGVDGANRTVPDPAYLHHGKSLKTIGFQGLIHFQGNRPLRGETFRSHIDHNTKDKHELRRTLLLPQHFA